MDKSIQVNEKDYGEVKLKCEKCHEQLLVFVHRNIQDKTCILGCGYCGHPNQIKLEEQIMFILGLLVMGISLLFLFGLAVVWIQLLYLKVKEKEQTE